MAPASLQRHAARTQPQVHTTKTVGVLCGSSSRARRCQVQGRRERLPPPPHAFLTDAPPQRSGAAELLERLAAAPSNAAPAPAPAASHPVLRLMQQRLRSGGAAGTPGRRPDGCKIGLVVEGGGMRGIVTGAMLMGLQDAGLTPVFDAVYGASAGAINATYFLSGQPEGLDIYTDHLAVGERFLSLRRYWSSRPVMDLDFLLDEVMAATIPLDHEAVLASQLPLVVVASSLTSLRSELLTGFGSAAELVEALKASACVPEIVGGPRSIRLRGQQHQLVDAAVFEPLPVKAALRDGCTHVLALCSRPPSQAPAWSRYLTAALTSGIKYWMLNPPYMREAWRIEPLHSMHDGQPLDELLLQLAAQGKALELDAALDDCVAHPEARLHLSPASSTDGGDAPAAGGYVFALHPGAAAGFAPLCKHVPTLQLGRQDGYRRAQRLALALQQVAAN